MKKFCFIPAKSASTRLKKKNIKMLAGKEMIYYSIKAAQESGLFGEDIIVSTESEEIKEIAEKYGAKVPFLRDEKLAHDPYGVKDVALDFLEKKPEYKNFDNLFILLPTAPLMISEDIIKAYKLYINGSFKYLMSITETEHNAQRSVYNRNNEIVPINKEMMTKKSQELETTYKINGAVTIVNIKDFLISKQYFTYPLGAYMMPRKRSIDVDTEFDFEMAKYFLGDR